MEKTDKNEELDQIQKKWKKAEGQMMGSPSLNFIRKLYNTITYKFEQLEEIKQIEQKLKVNYNGDLELAYNQCKNGNWTLLTEEQLEDYKKKDWLETSI